MGRIPRAAMFRSRNVTLQAMRKFVDYGPRKGSIRSPGLPAKLVQPFLTSAQLLIIFVSAFDQFPPLRDHGTQLSFFKSLWETVTVSNICSF